MLATFWYSAGSILPCWSLGKPAGYCSSLMALMLIVWSCVRSLVAASPPAARGRLGRHARRLVDVVEGIVPALQRGAHEAGGRVLVAVTVQPPLVGDQRAVRDRDAVVGRVDDGELVVFD